MTARRDLDVEVLADPEALSERVAEWMLDIALATDGPVAIALAGGSTPRRLYRRLSCTPYREAFPWSRAHWFWGDERFVPRDDAQSNFRMVDQALLSRVPAPGAKVHAFPIEGLKPEAAAHAYERELQAFYGADRLDPARPLFDVVLLGLGADGHTASLFPGAEVLGERASWVAPTIGPDGAPRLTLTFPALESSRHAAFLVEGAAKRDMFARLRRGDRAIPAARLQPTGELRAFVNAAVDEATSPAPPPPPSAVPLPQFSGGIDKQRTS